MSSKSHPKINTIKKYDLPLTEAIVHDNGIEIVYLPAKELSLVKMNIIIDGGRHLERKRFVSKLTSLMLKQGKEKSQFFDHYGVKLKSIVDLDYIGLVVISLSKHLDVVLPYLVDCLNNMQFVDNDIEQIKRRSLSALKFDESNSETMSYRHFTQKIFGASHPYGYNSNANDIESANQPDLEQFYQDSFVPTRIKVYLTGNISDAQLEILSHLGSNNESSSRSLKVYQRGEGQTFHDTLHLNQPGQASIKIGRSLFDRRHHDYLGVYVYNVALGGYFGSLLSKRIREEQGLTYGIYSHVETFKYDGIFAVSTEVNPVNTDLVVAKIFQIMEEMRTAIKSEEDLFLLKNYIKGYLLSIMDGPLNQIEVIQNLGVDGLNMDFVDHLFSYVQNVKAEDIRDIANKYFNPESMSVTVIKE